VRFDTAHAHNVVTLPSHVNMLTGRLPFEHGVRDNNGFRVPKDEETLATLLKPRGFRSGGFVSAFVLDERFGLASGFDRWDSRVAGGEWSRGPHARAARRDRRRGRALARGGRAEPPSSISTSPTRPTAAGRFAGGASTYTAKWRRPMPRSSRCCGRSSSRAAAAERS
jgi:arylsulfatase A-like enzyme